MSQNYLELATGIAKQIRVLRGVKACFAVASNSDDGVQIIVKLKMDSLGGKHRRFYQFDREVADVDLSLLGKKLRNLLIGDFQIDDSKVPHLTNLAWGKNADLMAYDKNAIVYELSPMTEERRAHLRGEAWGECM